ncbi:gliding motility protein RemB (plasmid) [Pedobacter sp. BS3]|uniref:gliding motility protein RemB n=1 Tax=Pedobacter sp. BS3 TaxID=2567937 RepID=UPI0011EC7C4E|nr:gliding motility protein RemB [Pedobacter sp. BS3]TZF86457.1 gliding motility protein RemB [Pedobacter sp. BS3]
MKRLAKIVALWAFAANAWAQTPNQVIPYTYQFYQKLNNVVYSKETRFHSAIRPSFADDSVLAGRYNELMSLGVDTLQKHSWGHRKLFNEHLLQFRDSDYQVYADFLPDFQVGKEFADQKTTWLYTRGYQVGGNVGKKFSFYTSGYENQGVFPNYLESFIDSNKIIPGQVNGKINKATKDWAYVTALLSYTPNKYLNLALGYDKNFIGDGYRSMLLSDLAANYSFFRLRASLGNVTYQAIYAYMADPGAERFTTDRRLGDRHKWGVFHYVDWNVNKRLSLGFFQAITWAEAEKEGYRGFDFNYIHPFVFLRPIEGANSTSPDKLRLGLNTKYELFEGMALYGQFMIDEFTAKEFFAGNGYWANKWAAQFGIRGADIFHVKNLNYLFEFNTARPYTYSHFDRVSNYAHYNQPLAHPFGANFREFLSILNYSVKRFDFQGQLNYARYGLDPAGENYGKNIFLSYDTRSVNYGSHVGQGIGTDFYYGEGKVAYLLNPKYNLRLELGAVARIEKNSLATNKTGWLTFGLRSSFRNLYQDF